MGQKLNFRDGWTRTSTRVCRWSGAAADEKRNSGVTETNADVRWQSLTLLLETGSAAKALLVTRCLKVRPTTKVLSGPAALLLAHVTSLCAGSDFGEINQC